MTVVCTVILSILAHGLTANPLAAAFSSRNEAAPVASGSKPAP
jgi:hypothetical protein